MQDQMLKSFLTGFLPLKEVGDADLGESDLGAIGAYRACTTAAWASGVPFGNSVFKRD
jgi:hypothetical protein